MLRFKTVRKFNLLLCLLPSILNSNVWAQSHDGYIRLNGHVLTNLKKYVNEGYPTAINEKLETPPAPCPITDEPEKPVQKKVVEQVRKPHTDPTIDPEILKQAYEAKEALEEEISIPENVFEDLDTFFLSITNVPPPDCGYKLYGFGKKQVQSICDAMDDLAHGKEIRQSARCHVSNCSTASYMGIIQTLRTREDWPQLQDKFTCKSPFPKAYLTYVSSDGLRKFAREYNLGETKRIGLPGNSSKKSQLLSESLAQGWPQKSDPILLQRDHTKKNTAHAVIFSHYESEDGSIFDGKSNQKIAKVCYWSSNMGTNGTANRCESISYMSFIDSARLKN